MKIIAECDGSGNSPRGSSCGAVLMDENREVLLERSELLPVGTNNVAEYRGVLLVIKTAIELEATSLEIFSDSQLIVNQVNDEWQVKDDSLLSLRDEVWDLASALQDVSIHWFRREHNKRADKLCRDRLPS